CGFRKLQSFNRIVGGVNVQTGEWPWQVSLQYRNSHTCGASIISNTWLVSAAHCFEKYTDPSRWTARMGTIRKTGGTVVNINRIIVHENYDTNTNDYDVAVLELSSPVAFDDNIQPVCLPSAEQTFDVGITCTISGWGRLSESGSLPQILQKAEVNIIGSNVCRRSTVYGFSISPRMLCAGFLKGEIDACQ
uniref:Peptidase S1 domain-containing protein n=1 Tax=Latimeria chalumnae TaxID=7897 RepID=H2ZSM9_LATCH